MKALLCIVILGISTSSFAQRNGIIFLARHAERNPAPMGGNADDISLNETGEKRAECLAETLSNAGITQIYVTNIKRTQQTAAPLAHRLHVQPTIVPKANTDELVKDLESGSGNALTIEHADTLPGIIQQLGAGTIPAFANQDYDRLLVVPIGNGKAQAVTTIHYCPSQTSKPE